MISSLWVKLASPEAITGFRQAIRADPRLSNLLAQTQIDYYERRIGNIAQFIRYMAAGVSVLLGLGACLVIAGMLGIALHHRRRQTATLRSPLGGHFGKPAGCSGYRCRICIVDSRRGRMRP